MKFNGGAADYDGVGRSASDNDSWYPLLWSPTEDAAVKRPPLPAYAGTPSAGTPFA